MEYIMVGGGQVGGWYPTFPCVCTMLNGVGEHLSQYTEAHPRVAMKPN